MSNNEPTMTIGADMVPLTAPSVPAIASMPMRLLQQAVDRGDSTEVLSKLMDLNERFEATQARKEFDAAFAAVKAEVGIVRKTGIGHQGKAYADLADIARALDPVIAKHGLSYRFRSQRIGNELVMTCIVCHRAGHFEENSLPSPLGTSGSKNAVQAVGSTSTYLQRYTLVQAFGLAASVNGDINNDDGQAASVKDGWPRGLIYQKGDYADGVPEKQTKPAEQKTYSRNPGWVKLQTELDAMVEAGAGPVEIFEWGSEVEPKLRNWPAGPRGDWLRYVAAKVQEAAGHAVEANGELTHEDTRQEEVEAGVKAIEKSHSWKEPQKISERATALRDGKFQDYVAGRPSRKNARPPEPTDEIDDILRS